MSIHHRSQSQINKRRQAIQDRKRGGVLGAWVAKVRRMRRGAHGRGRLSEERPDGLDDPDLNDGPVDHLRNQVQPLGNGKLSLAELLVLILFWTVVLFGSGGR
jgi:hypothetical protein